MEKILAPSILSADFNQLGDQMRACEEAGAKYLHFDVMDGIFVPNISFGIPVLSSIKDTTDLVMDVHLMITEPIRYVTAFQKAGADILTIHYEACEDVQKTLDAIHAQGMKAGISIKPDTPCEALLPYLNQAELILVMSVEPGAGGQSFIPASLDKIRLLRSWLDERNLTADLEVDGGLNLTTTKDVIRAGANVIVAGSAVFKGDIKENVLKLREILETNE